MSAGVSGLFRYPLPVSNAGVSGVFTPHLDIRARVTAPVYVPPLKKHPQHQQRSGFTPSEGHCPISIKPSISPPIRAVQPKCAGPPGNPVPRGIQTPVLR